MVTLEYEWGQSVYDPLAHPTTTIRLSAIRFANPQDFEGPLNKKRKQDGLKRVDVEPTKSVNTFVADKNGWWSHY